MNLLFLLSLNFGVHFFRSDCAILGQDGAGRVQGLKSRHDPGPQHAYIIDTSISAHLGT